MENIIKKLTLVDEEKVDELIFQLLKTEGKVSVGFLNQHAFNLIFKDKEIRDKFFNLDFLLRDGKGIEIACRYCGLDPKYNLNGTDFIPRLIDFSIEQADLYQFFIYGTQDPWLEIGAKSLLGEIHYKSLDGFKDEKNYLEHFARNAHPEKLNILILGMGMPKQEKVAKLLKKRATQRMLIICGGAVIDFQAGRFTRSPEFIRNHGFEWFYRLIIEPKRLFMRYVIGIPLFFINLRKCKKLS